MRSFAPGTMLLVAHLSLAACEGADGDPEAGDAASPRPTRDAAQPALDASPPQDAAPPRRDDARVEPDSALAPPTSDGGREPCCSIDGGAPPPTKALEGCASHLLGETPPPADVCALNGASTPSSVSIPLVRKLLAGHSYRFSYTLLQLIDGDPIIVDVFGSDQPCVRGEPLFTLTLDGRLHQEACFTPTRDVDYFVTRVQVGGVAFNQMFGEALSDTCEASCN